MAVVSVLLSMLAVEQTWLETVHTYNVQATVSGNVQVFADFSPKISLFRLLKLLQFTMCL